MEELLSVASTRIATMYHNNPVSLDVLGGSPVLGMSVCVYSACLCVSPAVYLALYKIVRVPVMWYPTVSCMRFITMATHAELNQAASCTDGEMCFGRCSCFCLTSLGSCYMQISELWITMGGVQVQISLHTSLWSPAVPHARLDSNTCVPGSDTCTSQTACHKRSQL